MIKNPNKEEEEIKRHLAVKRTRNGSRKWSKKKTETTVKQRTNELKSVVTKRERKRKNVLLMFLYFRFWEVIPMWRERKWGTGSVVMVIATQVSKK